MNLEGEKLPVDLNDFSVTLNSGKVKFDFVYVTIHGDPGENGKLMGYFDMVGQKYLNAGATESAVSFNKFVTNRYLRNFDVNVAAALLFSNGTFSSTKVEEKIGFPCFVKPNNSGSSYGVSKVNNTLELKEAINNCLKESEEVLVESLLVGREITCGVVGIGNDVVALPVTEIITNNQFFDFEAKYKGESSEVTPAQLSSEITKEVQQLTVKTFQLLGLKGIGRADYILGDDGRLHFIEMNTTPGMSDASIVPQQLEVAGMTLTEVIIKMIDRYEV